MNYIPNTRESAQTFVNALKCGGGGGDTSQHWGRKADEDDRRLAYSCMIQVYKVLK